MWRRIWSGYRRCTNQRERCGAHSVRAFRVLGVEGKPNPSMQRFCDEIAVLRNQANREGAPVTMNRGYYLNRLLFQT
jgi:hypothetical protein